MEFQFHYSVFLIPLQCDGKWMGNYCIVNFGTDRRLHFQNLVVFIFLSYCVLYFCSRIVVASLKEWGVEVDDAFFLGGIDKSRILNIMKPHIFFDDQMTHLDHIDNVPAVHIPFGIANKYVGYD